MADEPISSDDQSMLFCIKSYLNHTSSCNLCEEYKHRLEELTQELLSAKKIIQLLQEDVKVDKVMNVTQTASQHTVTQRPNKSNPQVSNKADIWETGQKELVNSSIPHIIQRQYLLYLFLTGSASYITHEPGIHNVTK